MNGFKNIIILFLIFVTMLSPDKAYGLFIGDRVPLFKIDKIEVVGNKKVEKQAILEKLQSKVGTFVSNYTIKADILQIYKLKYFASIKVFHIVRNKKNILQFKVKELPVISKIVFDGNSEFEDSDLKEKIKTVEYSILNINSIKEDVDILEKEYQGKGYFLSKITYKLKRNEDNELELHFVIDELDQVKVKKIVFIGNNLLNSVQLKSIMQTKENSLLGAMSGAGNFKEFDFKTDIERIKYFYKTKGFLQINVGTPVVTISVDKRWVFIEINVNEGPQFIVNEISFIGENFFSEDMLRRKLKIKANKNYSEDLLRMDLRMLTEKYQDKGYAFANVLRNLVLVPGENKVNVEFSFEPGKIVKFGEIKILGNSKTRDKVIRRELRIREGSIYSGSLLRKSKENIERLGFFEKRSVIINTSSVVGKDDVLNVEVSVKERSTGQISMGAGFSTASKGFLNASIAQTNFMGKGQNLNFSMTVSSVSKVFNIGFTEPYLNDSKWTGGFDLFRNEDSQSSTFQYTKVGGDLRVGYPIFEYTRLYASYKYEDTLNVSSTDTSLNTDLEKGNASLVKTTLVLDKRNNVFETSGGYYVSLSSEFAGLGGHKKWWKNELELKYYKTVIGDLVFRSRYVAKMVNKVQNNNIARTEKYTLGGPRDLRGYLYDAIGIFDTATITQNNQQVTIRSNMRSNFATFMTFEFEHPLAREAGLKWVVFYDIGDANNISNLKMKSDYGFGLRWFAPIGVMRFEWAYPIHPTDGASSQFIFDIGQLF